MAEQLGLHHLGRHRGAVDRHEQVVRAIGRVVDGTGGQLLAGSRLAGDQHGRARRADLADLLEHALHGGAVPEEAGLGRRGLFPQVVVLELEPFARQHPLDGELEDLHVERTQQVVLRTQLHGLHRGGDGALGRHDDGGRGDRARRHPAQQLDAVGDRHAQVGQHQIHLLALEHRQRLATVRGDQDAMPELLEHDLEDAPHVGFVIDHQHRDSAH